MLPNKTLRYAMFALLYFAQGAIMSYFTAMNALYLLSFKLTMSQIGLFGAIALIPFVLKIFLGMLSDKVSLLGRGHRRPYIILGLFIQALCLFIVPYINPGTHFGLFCGLALVLMSGMALYDTCTDGLALDTTPADEQGRIQGFMVGGRALGVVTISAALGLLVQLADWRAAFWTLGLLTLVPLPLVLKMREPARPAERQFEWGAFRAFAKRPVLALAGLGILYSLIVNGGVQILNPFLQRSFNISYVAAGLYTAVWGLGVVIGGMTGGRLTDRIGHRRTVTAALALALVAVALLATIRSAGMAWPLALLFGLAFGFYESAYFATAMSVTDPRIAASMYAILMAAANVGTGIGLAASGALVDALDFRTTFLVIAGLNLLALPLLPLIFQARKRPS